ncbi:HTH domain-containing protein [Mesobacillus harenae]|uniref:HTH domain-containing protein n=1 Tax=Mesobacillus harenae TaxID=2213203 RepID=UPI00157FDC47|nr:HTH domain-containing protein [Mesobacillus harenae]
MGKNLYTDFQIKELEKNPNVLSASDRTISYSREFKVKAIEEYKEGKTPVQIFIDHGFDLVLIGRKQPQKCLHRWRKTYDRYGKEGLLVERRGKGSTGRPSSKSLSAEEKLRKAEARIRFLEAENDFLKKLKELERQAKKKRF